MCCTHDQKQNKKRLVIRSSIKVHYLGESKKRRVTEKCNWT